jgi:hypothetical protein
MIISLYNVILSLLFVAVCILITTLELKYVDLRWRKKITQIDEEVEENY